jgi:hypothetical protein
MTTIPTCRIKPGYDPQREARAHTAWAEPVNGNRFYADPQAAWMSCLAASRFRRRTI